MLSDPGWDTSGTCENCHSPNLQKQFSVFGQIALYSTWWCGIGALLFKWSMQDYCEVCYQTNIARNTRKIRFTKLFMEDLSICEQPVINKEEVLKKFDSNVVIP